jgi:hypothetical protein
VEVALVEEAVLREEMVEDAAGLPATASMRTVEVAAYFVLEVDRGTIPLIRTDVPDTAAGEKAFRTSWRPAGKDGKHSSI